MSGNFTPRTRSNKGWIVVAVFILAWIYLFIREGIRTGQVKDVFAAAPTVAAPSAPAAIRAEPTVDFSAQIAADNERVKIAEQGRYDAQLTAIAAKQEAVDALAAQQAAQVVLIQITQQAEQNQIVAEQIEITRQANDIALAEEQNRAVTLAIEKERVNMEASARAVENRKNTLLAENAAKYDAKKFQAEIIFKTWLPFSLAFLGLVLSVWLAWSAWYGWYQISNPPAPVEEPAYRPVVAIHEHLDSGETIRMIQPPPCTVEIFTEWAGRMLSGDSAAINHWEADDSPFNGKDYRRQFYPWLVANKLVKFDLTDGRSVLSDRGVDYCNDWLIRNPTHSPDDEVSPKSASTPAMSMETMPMDGRGRGFTPMSEPFPGS